MDEPGVGDELCLVALFSLSLVTTDGEAGLLQYGHHCHYPDTPPDLDRHPSDCDHHYPDTLQDHHYLETPDYQL